MKYFLGEAANYSAKDTLRHLFAVGTQKDSRALREFLAERYQAPVENVALTKNGRSAIALALKALVPRNSKVVVNGFTCQAVLEAVIAAGCVPIFADIEADTLHYGVPELAKILKKYSGVRAVIIQNSLGVPVSEQLLAVARRNKLAIIEDLAHSANTKYASGALAGTVGDAACLSFGKGKVVDTITGGAVILRTDGRLPQPSKHPRFAENFRARLYPVFGASVRALFPSYLCKIWLGALLKLHFIERSADSPLNTEIRLAHWQSKLALRQLKNLPAAPIRKFYFVNDRKAVLEALSKKGYYFDEIWYDCPVSPRRNYLKWQFPESECPNAVRLTKEIINLPTHYSASALKPAETIIKEYLCEKH